MTQPSVLAIAAHPDDIEFVMAGTLLRLVEAGWQAHYFNLANGCYGSMHLPPAECSEVRLLEAKTAAALIPATFYPPICNDLEVFYNPPLLAQVAWVVRQAKPSIVLTHSLSDYMEDHQNAARLAVTAAFCRGMPHYPCDPPIAHFSGDIAVYHAQPHGNRDPMGNTVVPSCFVDVTDVLDKKRQILATHVSQDQWLDASQGMSSYLQTMQDLNLEVGRMSKRFEFAEGWRQHIHLGLSTSGYDPLRQSLNENLV